MVLTAVRGALGFLSRLPIGRDRVAWVAFRATPAAMPLSGYVLGVLLALPLALPAPARTRAIAFVATIYLVTGPTHADGLADLGDAIAVHGDAVVAQGDAVAAHDDAAERRRVMRDSAVGVGGTLALVLVLLGLTLAALSLATLPLVIATTIVIGAEVGAKAAMATLVCFGTPSHDGMGGELLGRSGPLQVLGPAVATLPMILLTIALSGDANSVETAVRTVGPLLGALVAMAAIAFWARRRIGGVSGDVLGATNEVARVLALHLGVIAWTRF